MPATRRPTVVRLSRQSLLHRQSSIHAENADYSFVHVQKRHRSLTIKKNTIQPLANQIKENQQLHDQNKTSHSSIHIREINSPQNFNEETRSSPSNSHQINQTPVYKAAYTTSIKSKDTRVSLPYDHMGSFSSKSPIAWRDIGTVGDKDKEERRKKRRRGGMFKMTRCCCCLLMIAALGAILLGALIAAIIMLTTQAKTTVTTSTTTTATSTTTTETTSTTSTTSSSTTSTTTTTTTTTSCTSCTNYCWNQTGVAVADTSSNSISDPRCVYVDASYTIYVCGHTLGYVQKWVVNTTTRTAATNNYGDHIDYIIFDKNGYMYTNDHSGNLVRRYPPNSLNDTVIVGTGSSVSGSLNHPAGLAIDENFTLYIADQNANRVAKWSLNATSVVTEINTNGVINKPSALLLAYNSSSQIYISDEDGTAVYLWTFGVSTPNVTLTQVNDGTTLKKPRGIKLDAFGNLYVADKENSRVVMYCANSTIGTVILQLSDKPADIAFDSDLNLYAIVDSGKVLKFGLL